MVKKAAAVAGDMPSFEEDAMKVEKPGVALPLSDMEVERWKKDDVKLLEPPKADDAGRDVNPFSALNSQMSEFKISQTEATDPARDKQETWRAFDFSTMTTENNELDTKQEEKNKDLDLVKEDKVGSTKQHEDWGRKEMDTVVKDSSGKEKQEKKVQLVVEHEEAKEKKDKEKKEKKDKKDKNDVDTLIKKLEKMDAKIERILAKKQQYEQQLKEAKERRLQRAENQSVPYE